MTYNGLTRGVIVLAAAGLFAVAARAADADVAGTWKLTIDAVDGKHELVLTVTKEKSGYKGEYVEGDKKRAVKDFEFKDGKLRFKVQGEHEGSPANSTFEGKVTGDAVKGECHWEYQGLSGSFPFTGQREAAKPK
jgi:hypothetical protein